MKILFIHTIHEPARRGGGAEVVVWETIKGLQAAGHDCVLLSTTDQPGLHCHEYQGVTVWLAGIKNIYWHGRAEKSATPARMIWHLIDSYSTMMQGYVREVVHIEQPQIISAHDLMGFSIANTWKTARKCGVPLVQVLHGYEAICAKASMYKRGHICRSQCASCRILRLPHRASSNQVAAVVGVSQFILDLHVAEGYFSTVRMRHVINNARSMHSLELDAASPTDPHTGIRFGYIGRLDPPKGVEPLIDAFRQLLQPDAELWIAGTGKPGYEASLRQRAQGDPRIRFLGRVRPVEFFPQVDAVVVPSLWNDNLPGVVFEAFAFGRPVIGARRGGIVEMVRDGENGFLIEPNNLVNLQGALNRLIESDVLLHGLAENARISAARFTDVTAYVEKHLNLYTEILASHSGVGAA